MAPDFSPAKEQEWQRLIHDFQNKSDRATAILGAVYLETYLGHLAAGFFVNDPGASAKLLDKEYPLGNFSARIKTAYCLGLISSHEHHDLNLILQVRNTFLADVEAASFEDAGIRKLCYRFKIARDVLLPGETRTPRHLFVFTCTILIQHLFLRTEQACKERRETPDEFMLVHVEHEEG